MSADADNRASRRHAVGRRLAVIRTELELTQAGFAQMLGVSTPTYGAWESGQRDIPPMFAALQEVFGIDPQTVLFDRPTEPPAIALNSKRLQVAYRMAGRAVSAASLRIPDADFWDLVGVAYDLGPGAETRAALVELLTLKPLGAH